MCVCLHVEWLNKHVKLIKGREPRWFQRPTSHPILSPSLVARPSSSSDLCQVMHRYLLPPQRELELDQPLPLLAIFAIQCIAFILEKWCVGVDCWSNCSRLLRFRPLPQHWFQTSRNPEVLSFWICPWKWNVKCVSYCSSRRCMCAVLLSLCASRVQLLSASPSVSLLFCFIWRCCQ